MIKIFVHILIYKLGIVFSGFLFQLILIIFRYGKKKEFFIEDCCYNLKVLFIYQGCQLIVVIVKVNVLYCYLE